MSGLEVAYLLCVVAGLTWAVLSAVVGGIFGGDHGADGGGHDAGGAGGAAAGHDHAVHFSPLSPSIIAIFVTAFGSAGYVSMEYLKVSAMLSLPIAIAAAFLAAGAMFFVFAKIFEATQQSSAPAPSELVGLVGQVLTAIPENGVGEISYTVRGSRFTAPAKHVQGWAVPAHAPVIIESLAGSVFFVRRGD